MPILVNLDAHDHNDDDDKTKKNDFKDEKDPAIFNSSDLNNSYTHT